MRWCSKRDAISICNTFLRFQSTKFCNFYFKKKSHQSNQLTAVKAASDPLFPALPPARFKACNNTKIMIIWYKGKISQYLNSQNLKLIIKIYLIHVFTCQDSKYARNTCNKQYVSIIIHIMALNINLKQPELSPAERTPDAAELATAS